MRPLRALVIYIVAVFIGGALLAPLLYWVAQHFASSFPMLATEPFHRFVDRSILGIALVGLWPLVKNLGFASVSEAGFVSPHRQRKRLAGGFLLVLISLALVAGADFASKVGLVRPRGQGKRLAGGFLLGLISLALVAGTSFACHARVLSTKLSGGEIAHKLLGAAATAILVAVLEEILFRGALFGALRKAFNWIFALVVSSFVYALLHYFKSADITGPVTWTSGLRLLPLMFQNLANFHAMVPGFFNLTLAGILLSWAYHRTGNLYFSIGLHAGWIFWIKAYAIVSGPAPQANLWLWGSGSMAIVNGWIAVPVLLLTLLVFVNLIPRKA